MDYATVKLIHQGAVTLSLGGFAVRGAAMLADAAWVRGRLARTVPHVVDTVLLGAGLTLAWMLRMAPGNGPWLTAKLVGLVVYILLGSLTLRARSRRVRAWAWLGALATAGWIVSVALTKNPWGWPGLLLHLGA